MGLVAITRSICTAAICDEYQIIFNQVNGLVCSIFAVDNLFCNFLCSDCFNDDILDIHAVFNLNAMSFQVFHQRQNHAFILVVLCETECTEIRQAINMVHISAQIPFHFQSTRPTLKSKHRLPVQPEVCFPKGIWQNI